MNNETATRVRTLSPLRRPSTVALLPVPLPGDFRRLGTGGRNSQQSKARRGPRERARPSHWLAEPGEGGTTPVPYPLREKVAQPDEGGTTPVPCPLRERAKGE